mgnify:CR=1 FL=1
MRRSKLESCEEILGVLVKEPLIIDSMAYKTSMDCVALKQHLDFLIKNGLVEERISGKKTLYAVTERGMAVFKTLNFKKYLERVANMIRVMDEALQTVSTIAKRNGKKEKKARG